MKRALQSLAACAVALLTFPSQSAATPIVDDGLGNAQIVIAAEGRPRMVTLAALELQYYIEAISGARLPIVTVSEADPAVGVNLYVGASAATDNLGIETGDLEYGAYRIRSGKGWLAFVGDDYDYSPPHPSPEHRRLVDAARAEWDEITSNATDYAWGYPFANSFKHRWQPRNREEEGPNPMATRYGEANAALWPDGDFRTGFWLQDEGGSLNAVYAFLGTLGMRWYLPGDVGEVLPQKATIQLPDIDVTVEPDYKMRAWTWYNYSGFPFEHVIWGRRLGLNSGYPVLGNLGYAHGHVQVHRRDEMKEARPEYYALFNGERDLDYRHHGRACYSSEGLFEETVAYARFLFDVYNEPHVSIWPGDGFRKCQCEECAEKSPSEVVWGFVDRVGRELYKTHPDRLVSCGAYTSYSVPPDTITQFSPNVAVFISNEGRPAMLDDEHWQRYTERIDAWSQRLAPGRILRVENNRYSLFSGADNPDAFMVPQARAMARDLQAMRGIAIGEHSEQSQSSMRITNPAMTHLPLYVQARYFWDAEQDYDPLFDEYCELFFGPVAGEVKSAYEFAEAAFIRAVRTAPSGSRATHPNNVPLRDRIELVGMLTAARNEAGDTIYGERVQLLLDGLQPLDVLLQQLEEQRVRVDRGDVRKVSGIIAGSSDEAPVYALNRNSGHPGETATVRFAWDGQALIVDVRCEQVDVESLSIVPDVRSSDAIVMLIETPGLSYYHIEVTPTGEVYDADLGGGEGGRWTAMAEVDSELGDGYWALRVRLPVDSGVDGSADPLHGIAAAQPTADNPWFINIGRRIIGRQGSARMSQGGASTLLLSPTREAEFGYPEKFVRLVIE